VLDRHSHLFCNDHDDDYDKDQTTMPATNEKTAVFIPVSCCQIVVCSLDRLCMQQTQA
jgi:hypothetical protein